MLASGMMAGANATDIEQKIKLFLDPAAGTQLHGRPIYAAEAKHCGLAVDELKVSSPEWQPIYELYYRTDQYVSTRVSKVVESATEAFYMDAPE
jgi:hypothetical protein